MAKKREPLKPTTDSKPLYLLLPPEILAEGERRAAAGNMSVQHVITLTLAMAWQVPPPPLRNKGRPVKKKSAEKPIE